MNSKKLSFSLLLIIFLFFSCSKKVAQKKDNKCSSNMECQATESCINSVCTPDQDRDAVPDDQDNCPDVANPDQTDTDGDNIGDACDENTSCETDQDCPSDKVCEDGTCTDACTSDADCGGSSFLCQQGHCKRRCFSDSDCIGQVCIDGICQDSECVIDSDCGQGYRCNNHICEGLPPCNSDSDCDATEQCENGFCQPRQECIVDENCMAGWICVDGYCYKAQTCQTDSDCSGGICILGQCKTTGCRGNSDCAQDQICSAGECINQDPNAGTTVDRVIILTENPVVEASETITMKAIALDQDGHAVPNVIFNWSVEDTQIATVLDQHEGIIQASDTSGSTSVTVTVEGSQAQDSTTLNVIQPASGFLVVRIVDEISRLPVEGANVVFSFLIDPVVTDQNGEVSVDMNDVQKPYDVSVFHEDYDYLTFIGLEKDTLLLAIHPRTDKTKAGGFVGQFDYSQVHTQGDSKLGLAGISFGNGLIDVDFKSLFGETMRVQVMQYQVPLPSGMTVSITYNGFPVDLKTTYYTLGTEGVRALWSFAGLVDSQKLMGLFQGSGSDPQAVMSILLPLFNSFDHGLINALQVELLDKVVDNDDFDGDGNTTELRPHWEDFEQIDSTPDTPQSIPIGVNFGALPQVDGQQMDFVILLGGANVDQIGFVPLGLNGSGQAGSSNPIPDPVILKMAPLYEGLEAGDYSILAMAVSGQQNQGGGYTNGHISCEIYTDDYLPASISFDTFPAFIEDGTCDITTRSCSFTGPGGDFYRLKISAQDGDWIVYIPVGKNNFDLPETPLDMTDRFVNANSFGWEVIEAQSVDLNDLADLSYPRMTDLDKILSGFSRY